MSEAQPLEELLVAGHVCFRITTFEEDEALAMVRDAAMALGRPLFVWSVSGGLQDGLLAGTPPIPNTDNPIAALNDIAARTNRPVVALLDMGDQLGDKRTLRTLRNCLYQAQRSGVQLVLVDHTDELPAVIKDASAVIRLDLPTDEELEQLVRETLREVNRTQPIEVDITRSSFHAIIRNLRGLSRRHARRIIRDAVAIDRRFDADDINRILAAKRALLGEHGLLQYVETPNTLEQIGGLRRLKRWLAQRERALGAEALRFGLDAPRGVLLLGVQGAGKSLCAKAIATAWARPLLRMDVGALYDKYVGESERRLRDALAQAEHMAPIILWIDEIEKAFASSAARSTDGGLSQRMFGSLLTWMQEHRAPVFLVATANDIEALPPELLRKGRFDEIFFVDLPGREVRREIFAIHLEKRGRDPAAFDLDALSDAADGYSGAEIEQAVIGGLHEAFSRGQDLANGHIEATLAASPPLSVTMAERIAALREWARERCSPAD